MPEAAKQEDVVEIADYLNDTIKEIDHVVAGWAAKRQELATRLAVIQAASDPLVHAAARDYEQRVQDGRPYEDAEDAESLLSEAHRKFGS